MAHPLMESMGTAYQLLFQDKINQIQTPKPGSPQIPSVPTPDGTQINASQNPGTAALELQNDQKAAAPPPASITNTANAASLLFPSAPGVGNNTSAADVLKLSK